MPETTIASIAHDITPSRKILFSVYEDEVWTIAGTVKPHNRPDTSIPYHVRMPLAKMGGAAKMCVKNLSMNEVRVRVCNGSGGIKGLRDAPEKFDLSKPIEWWVKVMRSAPGGNPQDVANEAMAEMSQDQRDAIIAQWTINK